MNCLGLAALALKERRLQGSDDETSRILLFVKVNFRLGASNSFMHHKQAQGAKLLPALITGYKMTVIYCAA